ncbi:C40 family peptidase [Arenimonas fontis]|uniref:NlpC/P60 family protein n=1 Tax=Arenimonas fontis TaxID=2608255 RepID=A0A5B2ZCH4_9GAMM|nr:C40 family peptidase [Arenimonas fontis]KAA2285779.1 NlpC/P60 family protein [Arenimonas fontis]
MASAHYPGRFGPAPVRGRPALSFPFANLLLAGLLLAGCAGAPERRAGAPARGIGEGIRITDVSPDDPARANDVLMRALGLVGTPYRWGGNTPEGGFDCSGLVGFVFLDAANVYLPRTTREIARHRAKSPPPDRLAPGDLVLFANRGQVFHIGIYVGEGRFVHAPSTGGTVRLDRLDNPYWSRHYAGARRLLD